MRSKILLLQFLISLLSFTAFSQDHNPFKSIGKKGKILTLSNGRYEELFDQDSIQQIGTVLMNIYQMRVVRLLKNEKEAKRLLDNSASSRFLSVDPISSTFPMLSPYQYASNCPIAGIDLDGLEFYFAADGSYLGQSKRGGTQIRVATEYHTYTTTDNNKKVTGTIFTKYKDIDKVDPNIASGVYETIFRREVGEGVKSIAVINATERPNLGAMTNDKGVFTINMANVENGEKLNADYFNASATLYHEDRHSIALPQKTIDAFSHFSIQKKVIENSGLYEKTTSNFQGYVKQLAESYLSSQETTLQGLIVNAHTDPSQIYNANYYLKEYQENIQYYNKKFKEKKKEYDFKTFEKTLYGKGKSIIK